MICFSFNMYILKHTFEKKKEEKINSFVHNSVLSYMYITIIHELRSYLFVRFVIAIYRKRHGQRDHHENLDLKFKVNKVFFT